MTGGGNGGYGHKSLAASFIDVWSIVVLTLSLPCLFGHCDLVYQTQPSDDEARRETRLGSGRPGGCVAAILRHGSPGLDTLCFGAGACERV